MKRTEIKTPFRYYDYGISQVDITKRDRTLKKVASYIGWIIIEFNSVEDSVNWFLKEMLSDTEGRDEMVFLFLSKMGISEKADLLINLYGKFVYNDYRYKALRVALTELESKLKDAIKRRNRYAHTNWSEVYEGKMFKIKTEAKRTGVYHSFLKFEESHMKEDLALIASLQDNLWNMDYAFKTELNSHGHEVLIFSYGSNMHFERLRKRVPSAKTLGTGKLSGYKLEFAKKSKDGSGKATVVKSSKKTDVVWGVISSISTNEKHLLDKAEGLGVGYNEEHLEIITETGEVVYPLIYVADTSSVNDSLCPYTWYKALIVEGAKQHGLPLEYIAALECRVAKEDSDQERAQKALKVLKKK